MDSAQFMAKYAKTSGLIDRLEALAVRAREAYAVGDKRMFQQWMGEYTPVWQQAQDGVSEIGESAIQNTGSGNPQLDLNSVANMYEELTRRFVNHTNEMTAFMANAQRENPQFLVSDTRTGSGGCYIASAVYGSYDAPEVLVLREFRDERLAKSPWGRGFIRLYYRISPTLAKLVVRPAAPFNRIVRRLLDSIVSRLQ